MLSAGTFGVLVPFFYYNVFGSAERDRKIFMGDTGALLLGERMGVRELLGCALMMAAVILAQLPGASGEQRQSGES